MSKTKLSTLFAIALLFASHAVWSQNTQQELLNNIENFKASGNNQQLAENLNKLAFYYWNNNDYEKAIEQFNQSVAINQEIGNTNAVKAIYSNIGMIYSDMLQPESSILYFRKSLLISRKQNKKVDIATNLMNISTALEHLNRHQEALNNLNEALPLLKEINNERLLRSCYGQLAEVYQNMGNNEKSMEYFSLYTSFEKQIQKKEVEKEKQEAAKKVKQMEQKASLATSQKKQTEKKLLVTQDSLKVVEQVNQAQQMRIQMQDLSIAKKEADLKSTRLLNLIMIIVIVFVVIMLVFIYRSFSQKKKHNLALSARNEEIKAKNKKIQHSINYAQNIQGALLPELEVLEKMHPESFVFFSPRDVVSGDFYWFAPIGKTKRIIAAIDCTGHGVPGAFMSMLGISFMDEIVKRQNITEPQQILISLHSMLNTALKQDKTSNADGMDLAICLIDDEKKELTFAGAGNPLVYLQDGELNLIRGDIFGVGGNMISDKRQYKQTTITIDKPTTCYIFSDGFADQFGGEKGKKYFTKNFKKLLQEIHKEPISNQGNILENKLLEWTGDKHARVDDVLVIGFKLD